MKGFTILLMGFLPLLCMEDTTSKEPAQMTALPKAEQTNSPEELPVPTGKKLTHFFGVNAVHEAIERFSPELNTRITNDYFDANDFGRLYCNMDWFTGDHAKNQLQFMPSRSGWFFDEVFERYQKKGIGIVMTVHHCPSQMALQKDNNDEDRPQNSKTADPAKAATYSYFAGAMGELAKRYGSTKHSSVRSNDGKSGLNLTKYIEVWNEPDKDWKGPGANFTAEQYAAFLSVCYDSIKAADLNMKVVMGGIAGPDTNFVTTMYRWFKKNRADKKFAADVVNFHDYAYNNAIVWGKTWPLPSPGEKPENSKLIRHSNEFIRWTRNNVPHAEVWISEFGWDTKHDSPLAPPTAKRDTATLEEAQANYLVRSFVMFAAAGIDKAQDFNLIDESQYQWAGTYGSSGKIDRTNWGRKKPSWYAVKEVKEQLAGKAFTKAHSVNNTRVYQFENTYVMWTVNGKGSFSLNGKSYSLSEKPIFVQQ